MQLTTAVLASAVLVCCYGVRNPVRYTHFEDYLRSLNTEEQALIANEATTSSSVEDDVTATSTNATSLENRREITCCMLGQIAGDKGYHCFAKFYAARLLMRNRNRAHNRKMSFYGRNRIPDYGRHVMRTFEQCVADRGAIFHKCCHLVAVERRDRMRFNTLQLGGGPGDDAVAMTTQTHHHHHPHHHQLQQGA